MERPFVAKDIDDFVRPGKTMVIELDDDVEYLVSGRAVEDIKAGKRTVRLTRLVDRSSVIVTVRRIIDALQKFGATDYLRIKDSDSIL